MTVGQVLLLSAATSSLSEPAFTVVWNAPSAGCRNKANLTIADYSVRWDPAPTPRCPTTISNQWFIKPSQSPVRRFVRRGPPLTPSPILVVPSP